MYEVTSNVTESVFEVEKFTNFSEFDTGVLFTQISTVLLSSGVFTILTRNETFFYIILTLVTKLFAPSEQLFLSPLDQPDELATIMAHGNIAALLENDKIVQNIVDTITNQDSKHGLWVQPDDKLGPLKNLFKNAKPENIKLLMHKISLKLVGEWRLSLADFMEMLDNLTDEQASAFAEAFSLADSARLLVGNGDINSASAGFNQFFRCLNPIKQHLVLDVLKKHIPEIITGVDDYLSVFEYLNDNQRENVLPNVNFLTSIGNGQIQGVFNKLPDELWSILDNPSIKTLQQFSLESERLGVMNEYLMDIIKDRLLKTSDKIGASSKIVHFIQHIGPKNRELFLKNPGIFVTVIKNEIDLIRIFSNLERSEKLSLFFNIELFVKHIILKSNDVQDTLNKLKRYLPGELIALLNADLKDFINDETSIQRQIDISVTLNDFFKYCLLIQECATILNRFLWESNNPVFPSFSTEGALRAHLKKRYTYSFSFIDIQTIVQFLKPNHMSSFFSGSFLRIIHDLTPVQIFNFFKIIAPVLYWKGIFSYDDIETVMFGYYKFANYCKGYYDKYCTGYVQNVDCELDWAQKHALLASLKDITRLLMIQRVEKGIYVHKGNFNIPFRFANKMLALYLTRGTQRYYADMFIEPDTRLLKLIFNAPINLENPYHDAINIFVLRLYSFFNMLERNGHSGCIGLYENIESTILKLYCGYTMTSSNFDRYAFINSRTNYNNLLDIERNRIQSYIFTVVKDILVTETDSISKLIELRHFITTDQFEIVCEEIRNKFPNRFRLNDILFYLKDLDIPLYSEYRRIIINKLGEYDCHEDSVNRERTNINQMSAQMPATKPFFDALVKKDVKRIKSEYERLGHSTSQSNFNFFQQSLRKLPEKNKAALEAADIDPYQLTHTCL